MKASKNISLTIPIFVLLASLAHTAELSKQPPVQVEGEGDKYSLVARGGKGRIEALDPEAANLINRYLHALEKSDWKTALSMCSTSVIDTAKQYPTAESFFNTVVPVKEILNKLHDPRIGYWQLPPKYFAYIFDVRISQPDLPRDVFWVWNARKLEGKANWEIDFPVIPFETWLANEKQEIIRVDQEKEQLIKELAPRLKGVRTLLTAKRKEFAIGEPIYFRLHLINQGDSILSYDCQQVAVNNSMTIEGPDGKEVKYMAEYFQTNGAAVIIKPGETKTLFDQFDITKQYDIRQPGKYRVQFNGNGLSIGVAKESTSNFNDPTSFEYYPSILPSNMVTITIHSGIKQKALDEGEEGIEGEKAVSQTKPALQIEDGPEVTKLLTALQDEKYIYIRNGIIPLIREIGNKEPISFLVEQLKSENRQRRCNSALALELLGDKQGVPAIIKELNDTSHRPTERIKSDGREDQESQVRQDHYYAALLLGILHDERAVPALIEATRGETIDYQAAMSLGQIGDKRAIPALHDMLERCSNKPFPRLFSAYGLTMLGDEEGLKVVIETLNNHELDWSIRRHAIEALEKLGDKEAVPYLIAALKDEHPNIRVSAAKALGAIGDLSALPALRQALEDQTETKVNAPITVSEAAAKAIAQIEGEVEDIAYGSNRLTYVDKKRGFRFECPRSWKIATGHQPIMHYRDTFITMNSAAQENLWITEKEVSPGSWRYNDKIVADQLPQGCIYMDIGWWEGPPGPRFAPEVTEMTSGNLADLLAKVPDEPTHDSRVTARKVEFNKWGRRWSIFVYFREPVSESNKSEIEKVLKSFRFETNPVGDEIWAIWKARQHLPSEAEPNTFVREGGNELHHVRTKIQDDGIYVIFEKAYPERKEKRKAWKYKVSDSGEVIPINKRESPVRDNNSPKSTLKWIDKESGEELFDISDIVRFDWDKQIFELTRPAAVDFMARLGSVGIHGRKFILRDSQTVIYKGTLVTPESSIAVSGPVIRDLIPSNDIKPPLFKIDGGYPTDFEKEDTRFSERLKKALGQADVLDEIDLNNPPAPIKKDSSF